MPIQKLSPNFEAAVGVEANNYQYNGIELVEDFGLHINHATFRTLDPQTGRWWQIDPMAEKFYAWSGYNSSLNNTLKHTDPDGRTPWFVNSKTNVVKFMEDNCVDVHVDNEDNVWMNIGDTFEGFEGEKINKDGIVIGDYVRGNEDGTISNDLAPVEITGSRDVGLSELIGYDVGVELSVGPQLGFSLGQTEVQVGGNVEFANFSLSNGLETISSSNVQMNIFAEAQKNHFGGGFEATLSGPVNRMGETLNYEIGGSAFNFVGQVQGTMGHGVNTHGIGGKYEVRYFGVQAILGIKFTISPSK